MHKCLGLIRQICFLRIVSLPNLFDGQNCWIINPCGPGMIPAGRLAGDRYLSSLSLAEAEGNPHIAFTDPSGSAIRPSISETASNIVDHIGLLCKDGQLDEALYIFSVICEQGLQLYSGVYFCLLQGCGQARALAEGRHIHFYMTQMGSKLNVYLGNALMNMYINCGCIVDARKVFDSLPERNVFTWTVIISGYVKCDFAEEALHVFEQMEQNGMPDDVCFVTVLNACAKLRALEKGRQVHDSMVKLGITEEKVVGNTLIDMYCKCGSLQDANLVFDRIRQDEVSWNALISGCAQHGLAKEAWALFKRMEQEKVKLGKVAFLSILKDIYVGSALVGMYAKCGALKSARKVFDQMPEHDVVSWSAMIAGYVQHGEAEEALRLWMLMKQSGMHPDEFTFVSILNLCAGLAALELGKHIHAHFVGVGIKLTALTGAAIVDMYGKCGSLDIASEVFEQLIERDVSAWNSVIAAYCQQGKANEVLRLVERMQQNGIGLDRITSVGVLSALGHSGLVREGLHYFDLMTSAYGVMPTTEHYSSMVDLLGRAGHLGLAYESIENAPSQPGASTWRAMLGASRIHGDLDLAVRAAKHVLELEPHDTAAFVLLANAYVHS